MSLTLLESTAIHIVIISKSILFLQMIFSSTTFYSLTKRAHMLAYTQWELSVGAT